MKAWLLDELNGIDKLRLADVHEPHAGAGEVVLAVRYASLNPADRYLAERQYPAKPTVPHVLGRDGVGVVVEIGPGVSGLKVGDQRAILRGEAGVNRWGTFAERVVVPADALVEVPAGWSEQEVAGATLVYLTAYQALTMWGELPPSVVLVTGASGGVGSASVQLAPALGHSVVALSRSESKRQRLEQLGAAIVLDPTDSQWRKKLKGALGDRRVDLAIDNIGGTLLPEVIDTLGENGKVSLVGRLAGPVPQFNTAALFFRRIRMGGVAVGTYSSDESRAAWEAVVSLMAKSGACPLVDRIFPFEQLPQAFGRLSEGPMGKVLMAVGG